MKRFIKRLYYRLRSNYTTEDLIKRGLKVGSNFKRMHDTIIDPSHCWHIQIGDNVIIGANSTITKNIPSNVVLAGAPAKIICSLEDYLQRNKELMNHRPIYNEKYTERNPSFDNCMREQMFESCKDGVGFVE